MGASQPQPAQPGLVPQPRLHWWGTTLYVPLLYGLGWLLARPLLLIRPALRPDQVDLLGAMFALLLLVFSLPWRLDRAWREPHPWRRLGLAGTWFAGLRALLRGLLKALALLAVLVLVVLLSGEAQWSGQLSLGVLCNSLALVAGVGFAEELLFRGWLWGELSLLLTPRRALVLQAALFALLHPWFQAPGLSAAALLGGLVLLGLALALQRRADGGLLWGAIGLHGGLVGGLFALQNGLLVLSPQAPSWLVGPGQPSSNPIGGLIGWLSLGMLIWIRRAWWEERTSS